MASNKEKENGRRVRLAKAMHMKETINRTRKMEKGFLHGQVETDTMEALKMMKDMGMAR
jgi:DNA-directed RNA polymerase sigma subunit (sigma70/sigma32)